MLAPAAHIEMGDRVCLIAIATIGLALRNWPAAMSDESRSRSDQSGGFAGAHAYRSREFEHDVKLITCKSPREAVGIRQSAEETVRVANHAGNARARR